MVAIEEKSNKSPVKKEHYFDYNFLFIVIFLVCFGLVMVYSSSAYVAQRDYGNSFHYFKRQAIFSKLF